MSDDDPLRAALEAANQAAPFHALTGFMLGAIGPGQAEIAFDLRPGLTNHAGALHAGVQCAALDTAAGYAAATLAGAVVTLQMSAQFVASAKGDQFVARADIVRQGKSQLFVEARLFARRDGAEMLVATASAVLTKVSPPT